MEFKKSSVNQSRNSQRAAPVVTRNTGVLSRIRSLTLKRNAGLAVLFLVTSGALLYSATLNKQPADHTNQPTPSVDYQTVTPHDKTIEQLGGWQRVSPPDKAPVFAYMDSLDGVRISVSQQPLPDKFIEGTDAQLAELAKNFGATTEIRAEQIKVYIGTSAKGPQSALFIKNGLLILVKSQSKISDEAWKAYAESLQ